MNWLEWLESTPPSTWVRETEALLGLPGMLFLHTVGMGLLVGTSLVIGLRVMGATPQLPLPLFARFRPLIGWGVIINVVSGLALLLAYPTKALTNPMFYAKLAFILIATLAWRSVMLTAFSGATPAVVTARTRRIMLLALFSWFAAVLCGRLLAYTYRHLMANSP